MGLRHIIKQRYGPGRSDREMNLDYRLTPTKCGFAASPVVEKIRRKKRFKGFERMASHFPLSEETRTNGLTRRRLTFYRLLRMFFVS